MLSNLLRQSNHDQPDIIYSKTYCSLPVKQIASLSNKIISAYTGPLGGLTMVNCRQRCKAFELPADSEIDFIDEDCNDSDIDQCIKSDTSNGRCSSFESNKSETRSSCSSEHSSTSHHTLQEEIAGVTSWDNSSDNAYGISTTLYESHPTTKEKAGEPIADSFGICVRENSAILALADGLNWGVQASIASRSAIHGCIEYLNKALYCEGPGRINNTMDVFVCLLRSFSAAHEMILQENGKLTTLTVATILQLENSDRFIVCCCNVGDSLAYVYSKRHGVREITQGSHDIFSMRDMNDALGALGPADGTNPKLNNLTLAMTIVDKDDIVFLTSDGVSDNFDPVVGKFAIPKNTDKKTSSNAPEIIKDENAIKVELTKKSNPFLNMFNGKTSMKLSYKSNKNNQNHNKKTIIANNSNHNHNNNNNNNNNYNINKCNINNMQNNKYNQNKTNNCRNSVTHSRRKSEGLINKISNEKSHEKNIGKREVKLRRSNSNPDRSQIKKSNLLAVTAQQRHELTLLRMEDLIKNGVNPGDTICTSAKRLCELMIEFVSQLTTAKRRILEDPELYEENDICFDQTEQRARRRRVGAKLAMVPGKLDHATVVACKVGFYGNYSGKTFENTMDRNKYNLRVKATLAQFESNDE